MFSSVSVCLSVLKIAENLWTDFAKFFRGILTVSGNTCSHFGNLDHHWDPEIFLNIQ